VNLLEKGMNNELQACFSWDYRLVSWHHCPGHASRSAALAVGVTANQ
jgi:hypothetical protein